MTTQTCIYWFNVRQLPPPLRPLPATTSIIIGKPVSIQKVAIHGLYSCSLLAWHDVTADIVFTTRSTSWNTLWGTNAHSHGTTAENFMKHPHGTTAEHFMKHSVGTNAHSNGTTAEHFIKHSVRD